MYEKVLQAHKTQFHQQDHLDHREWAQEVNNEWGIHRCGNSPEGKGFKIFVGAGGLERYWEKFSDPDSGDHTATIRIQ